MHGNIYSMERLEILAGEQIIQSVIDKMILEERIKLDKEKEKGE